MSLSCDARVSESSTLSSCLNVKELLARNRRDIWNLSDYNGTRTHNHLVRKVWPVWLNGWVFVYELGSCGFESRCYRNSTYEICFIFTVLFVKKLDHWWQWCDAVLQWLTPLYNFIQLTVNSGFVQAHILLVACRWFAMARISDNGPAWKWR